MISQSNGQPFDVKNPVVNEVLTEKWHEGRNYRDFVAMMKAMTKDVEELRRLSTNSDANKVVKKMFGETITNAVIKDYARTLNESRINGTLSVNSSGILNTNGIGKSVKKNTFYGDN